MNKEELIELLYQCFNDSGINYPDTRARELAELLFFNNKENIKKYLDNMGNALIKASEHIK